MVPSREVAKIASDDDSTIAASRRLESKAVAATRLIQVHRAKGNANTGRIDPIALSARYLFKLLCRGSRKNKDPPDLSRRRARVTLKYQNVFNSLAACSRRPTRSASWHRGTRSRCRAH